MNDVNEEIHFKEGTEEEEREELYNNVIINEFPLYTKHKKEEKVWCSGWMLRKTCLRFLGLLGQWDQAAICLVVDFGTIP